LERPSNEITFPSFHTGPAAERAGRGFPCAAGTRVQGRFRQHRPHLPRGHYRQGGQAKLEQEFSRREKELIDIGNALKSATEKFEREAPTMAESQRTTRQRQLVDQDREFQRKRREFQEDLNARKNEELAQVLERANKVVKQVAELRSTTSSCRKPSTSTPSTTSPTR
jgi:hypothetical protein